MYVTRFPSGDGKWQVAAGYVPKWNGKGTELFYGSSGDTLMAVAVSTRGVFSMGIPEALFSAGQVRASQFSRYDVTADGQRFVVVQEVRGEETPPMSTITVVQNWYKAFEERQ